jgi:hypothetical protein
LSESTAYAENQNVKVPGHDAVELVDAEEFDEECDLVVLDIVEGAGVDEVFDRYP